MKRKATILVIGICSIFALFQGVLAAVTAEEAGKLKTTLTPMGAEKAGNADGTIPAWDGGYTTVPPGYKSGDKRPDPFPNEKPLFTITSQNMDKYADKLAESTKYMLTHKADYRLDVYPTHRTAAAPQHIYDNTFRNATRAKTKHNGLAVEGAHGGIPFPIPKDGYEAIFNHLLHWQGESIYEPFRIYVITSEGKAILAAEAENFLQFPYYFQDMPEDKWDSDYLHFRQVQTAPAFKAGETILVKDPVDFYGKSRQAWQYLVGQRRTRRAPTIAYDTPDFVASGQQYFDETFSFNGPLDRFDWKLIGKKEIYIPYNCNKFYLAKDSEVLGKQYENPDYVRWELHRVWIVEATLAQGKRHVVQKRRFYLDEDTWRAILSDGWDGQGQLWRFNISFPVAMPDLPGVVAISFAVHNLQTGARTLTNLVNEMPVQYQVKPRWPETFFTPDALAGTGVR
jgi:hypothetical protein